MKWLVATATQGSADAFVEASFNTGLSNVTKTAYRIRRIEWILPANIGADSTVEAVLRRSSSASVNLGGSNAIIGCQRRIQELTTSGMVYQNVVAVERYERDEELLIVEENLYFQLDSAGTSVANVAAIRIGYETRNVTETERLSIQAATASG